MRRASSGKSAAAELLKLHMRANDILFQEEFRFAPPRRWRFDFCMCDRSLAIEVDGGNRLVRNGVAVGRHTKDADYEKLNSAALLGWRVLRFSPAQVKSGYAINAIKRALI